MTTTPSQEAQRSEAAARDANPASIPTGETAIALETVSDGLPQDPGGSPIQGSQPADEGGTKAPPPAKGAFDDKRAAIRARFREDRGTQGDDNTDRIEDFMRQEGAPAEVVGEEGDGGTEIVTPEPGTAAPEPRTLRLKVHGKEIDLTEEEVIAQAQIALASDNILEKAKSKLAEIDQLAEVARLKATQPSPSGQPAAQSGQQPELLQPETENPNQGDGRKLLEAIQFGDPEEAQRLLTEEIDRRADQRVQQSVKEQLLQQRLRDEGARTAAVLNDFAEKHPDIANDEKARAVIEVNTLRLQIEDLRKLGLNPDTLRQDGQKATAADISNAHRFYRAEGFAVRPPSELLETAFSEFQVWHGAKQQPAADPAPAPTQKAAPRVAVSVERQERRQAVQQQPSRTAAPSQASHAPPVAPRTRSDIVDRMKAQRAQLRGTNLGIV